MRDESTMSAAVRLTSSVEALAALAAHLRVESEQLDVDDRVRELLAAAAREIVGGARENGERRAPVDRNDRGAAPTADKASEAVVGMARSFLRQATDLIEHPARSNTWDHVDEALLQGIGRLSMAITDAFRAAENLLPGLNERLSATGSAFLDVGTGTGWLAIGIARTYPQARVVGLDIFEPALDLARRNVAAEGLDGRIELRLQNVADLSDVGTYDAIWMALPFLPLDIVPDALDACRRALRPGGWLLPGTFAAPPDPVSQLLLELRTVRAGGHPWTAEELVNTLSSHGMLDAQEVPRTWAAPVRLYAARTRWA